MNEKKILGECVEKIEDYEKQTTSFMSEIGAAADMFKIRPPKRKTNTFSNPAQTEFFRAASAVGVLNYRMMTAADPCFLMKPVDMNGDYESLTTLNHVILTQLKYAKWRQNLLRASLFAPVFGMVICQEDYRVIGVSQSGRRIPVTTLIPRVMDQVMFDRATTDIDRANWLATADVTSNADLMALAKEAKEIGVPWNAKALEAAANDKTETNEINEYVKNRLMRSGLNADEALRKKKELVMYYGKLDAMNDGIEYVVGIINRKYLVRFHANTFQHGRRPFRVSKWVDFDSVHGIGMGQLLGGQHRIMESHRQKEIDLASFSGYSMWKRRRNTVQDEDLIIRPLQVVDVDNMDDLQPLQPSLQGAEAMLKLDEILKQEFRSASGASDTLQAIADNAGSTATYSALSQNESLRAASVRAEIMSESLVREHIENLHANNIQNIREPFSINRAGFAHMVYPADLRMDVEFEAKTVTDKDYTPKRLQELQQMLTTLVSTKSAHPEMGEISIKPIVKEISFLLNVPPDQVLPNMAGMGGMVPGAGMMGAADLSGLAGSMAPGPSGGGEMMATPVGPVLSS